MATHSASRKRAAFASGDRVEGIDFLAACRKINSEADQVLADAKSKAVCIKSETRRGTCCRGCMPRTAGGFGVPGITAGIIHTRSEALAKVGGGSGPQGRGAGSILCNLHRRCE
jgi:hypothetical protein